MLSYATNLTESRLKFNTRLTTFNHYLLQNIVVEICRVIEGILSEISKNNIQIKNSITLAIN